MTSTPPRRTTAPQPARHPKQDGQHARGPRLSGETSKMWRKSGATRLSQLVVAVQPPSDADRCPVGAQFSLRSASQDFRPKADIAAGYVFDDFGPNGDLAETLLWAVGKPFRYGQTVCPCVLGSTTCKRWAQGRRSMQSKSLRAQIGILILATSIIQLANGFFGTFISLRVAIEDFAPAISGLVLSSYFAGFTLGALRCERIIERTGHIRAYAALAGMVVAATAAMPLLTGPLPGRSCVRSSVLVALVFSSRRRVGSTPKPSQLNEGGSSRSTCLARSSLSRWDSC